MAAGNTDTRHNIIVTTSGNQPEGFNLKNFEGLDGLFKGQLTSAEISVLAQDNNVEAIDLDEENFIS